MLILPLSQRHGNALFKLQCWAENMKTSEITHHQDWHFQTQDRNSLLGFVDRVQQNNQSIWLGAPQQKLSGQKC